MIIFKHVGDFSKTDSFLNRLLRIDPVSILRKHGAEGVKLLAASTPIDSGNTAGSWDYEVSETGSGYRLSWTNSNVSGEVVIAVILQYGHGTGTGGYVEGRDYINPVIRPIFDKIAAEAWKEVTR